MHRPDSTLAWLEKHLQGPALFTISATDAKSILDYVAALEGRAIRATSSQALWRQEYGRVLRPGSPRYQAQEFKLGLFVVHDRKQMVDVSVPMKEHQALDHADALNRDDQLWARIGMTASPPPPAPAALPRYFVENRNLTASVWPWGVFDRKAIGAWPVDVFRTRKEADERAESLNRRDPFPEPITTRYFVRLGPDANVSHPWQVLDKRNTFIAVDIFPTEAEARAHATYLNASDALAKAQAQDTDD